MRTIVVDYGSGNLRSAAKAFERAGAERGGERIVVSDAPGELDAADRIVLPGVGAFADCLRGLKARPGLLEALERNARLRAKPFLGVCVGMQLMAERGLEHGVHAGLGWIAGEVARIAPADPVLKVPHMGWNEIAPTRPHPLLVGIEAGAHAYFVHSYRMACADPADVAATVDYGGPLPALVARGNLAGTQFHPEKSQAVGLRLIGNFLGWRP